MTVDHEQSVNSSWIFPITSMWGKISDQHDEMTVLLLLTIKLLLFVRILNQVKIYQHLCLKSLIYKRGVCLDEFSVTNDIKTANELLYMDYIFPPWDYLMAMI